MKEILIYILDGQTSDPEKAHYKQENVHKIAL